MTPLIRDLDALYVNFISGFEIDLATMQLLRQHFRGPIYCDLHSLLLAVQPGGLRTPRPLAEVAEWCRCADLIQVNEDEMELMAPDADGAGRDGARGGRRGALSVTLGSRGVVYFAPPEFDRIAGSIRHGIADTALGVRPDRSARRSSPPSRLPPVVDRRMRAAIRPDAATCGAQPISLGCSRVIS